MERPEIYVYDKQHLPIGFSNIMDWINNRRASKHNEHLKQIMSDCGCDKAEGFIKVTHSASINDTFWIKSDTESVNWKDVSFYTNRFNMIREEVPHFYEVSGGSLHY